MQKGPFFQVLGKYTRVSTRDICEEESTESLGIQEHQARAAVTISKNVVRHLPCRHTSDQ